MDITLIHGQMHKGSTWHASTMLKEQLADKDTRVHEFFLPADGPGFCLGCFQCIFSGEETCPHVQKVQPIVQALEASEIIIIDSPTYCFEMSGQLKVLFDHLGYMWMSHRPNERMFHKTGIAVSTCAGAGAKSAVRSMARQLEWLGVAKVYQIALKTSASSFQDMPDRLRIEMEKETAKVAAQIRSRKGRVKPGLRTRVIFSVMGQGHKKGQWNPKDAAYWKSQGWVNGIRPWQ